MVLPAPADGPAALPPAVPVVVPAVVPAAVPDPGAVPWEEPPAGDVFDELLLPVPEAFPLPDEPVPPVFCPAEV